MTKVGAREGLRVEWQGCQGGARVSSGGRGSWRELPGAWSPILRVPSLELCRPGSFELGSEWLKGLTYRVSSTVLNLFLGLGQAVTSFLIFNLYLPKEPI